MNATKQIKKEIERTQPDYIVYVPKSTDGSTFDTGNEHFLVFYGPDGYLNAVWTQSQFEGEPNQRIVFSKSKDEGLSWASPKIIAGTAPQEFGHMASWQFPIVSESGRIYILYNHHIGFNDLFKHTTGLMSGIYSDDAGQTWSEPELIPMKRSKYDNPNTAVPPNWIVWQKPQRLSEGKYFVGLTRWVSPPVRNKPPIDSWIAEESVIEFMKFENIDSDPSPADIEISNFAFDDAAVRVSFPGHDEVSVAQEPSIVALPDETLFCVMRTSTGHPYYVISKDQGVSWSSPKAVLNRQGQKLLHPLSPCPIYRLNQDTYVLLIHNNDGHFRQWKPTDTMFNRHPVYAVVGKYEKNSEQPISFDNPKLLMDNEGVSIGYKEGRCDLAMYSSMTQKAGQHVLWYPERKFFLLGKNIDFVLNDE
jgi:hypothetical protein